MNKEIWKDIKDYEGLYQVSNLGKVRSLDHIRKNEKYENQKCLTKGRMLKPAIQKESGYAFVVLSKNGKTKGFRVHRLVAETFIQNPYNYRCVNHKDENKQNNNVNNLEFCSHKYNNNYGTKPKRISKANSKSVIQYDKEYNFIKIWESITEAEKYLKKKRAGVNISACCKLKHKTAYGYIWRYANVNSLQKN